MAEIFQPDPIRYLYVAGYENSVVLKREFIQLNGPIDFQFLHRIIIPPNTIVQDARRLKIWAQGATRRQNGEVTLYVRLNGFFALECVLPPTGNASLFAWIIATDIVRFSSNFYSVICECKDGFEIDATVATPITTRGQWEIRTSDLTRESLEIEFLVDVPMASDLVEQTYTLGSVI